MKRTWKVLICGEVLLRGEDASGTSKRVLEEDMHGQGTVRWNHARSASCMVCVLYQDRNIVLLQILDVGPAVDAGKVIRKLLANAHIRMGHPAAGQRPEMGAGCGLRDIVGYRTAITAPGADGKGPQLADPAPTLVSGELP